MRRPVLPNSGPSLAAESASLRHQLFDSSPEAAAAFSIVRYSSSVTLKLMCRVRFVSLIAASSLVLVLLIAEIAALSVYTHKPLQRLDHANVHALREHRGPRAGCRVTFIRCVAPFFIFSFAVENLRDVRRADDQRCNKSCKDGRRARSRVNYPKRK